MAKSKKQLLTCLKCGHVWTPRKKSPALCPRCKSKYWNVPADERTADTRQGRPRIEISRELFERLCQIQCTLVEISEFMQVSEETIDRFCRETYEGRTFSQVFEIKRASGKLSLRRTLFQLAQTTPSVAIFLAKNWLGMSDKQDVDHSGSISVIGTGYPGADKS